MFVRGLEVLALVDFFGAAGSATASTFRGTVMPDCERVLERAVVAEAILVILGGAGWYGMSTRVLAKMLVSGFKAVDVVVVKREVDVSTTSDCDERKRVEIPKIQLSARWIELIRLKQMLWIQERTVEQEPRNMKLFVVSAIARAVQSKEGTTCFAQRYRARKGTICMRNLKTRLGTVMRS